ncbi:MAG: hypothetical protein AB7K41_16270 [Bdellovibrionales bacterium]
MGTGTLSVTVGEVDGQPTVVVALGGDHPTGSEVEALALHVIDAVERASFLLEKRGTPVDFILMDGRNKS